jgi:hypothetical protein
VADAGEHLEAIDLRRHARSLVDLEDDRGIGSTGADDERRGSAERDGGSAPGQKMNGMHRVPLNEAR